MLKFLKSRNFWFILLFISIIPAFYALLKPGYYNMHDDMQMIRQLELDKCIHDGQIPCRWTPDLGYGYGYPLFNFYPPVPYIAGQVFRTFGISFMWSVKLAAVSQIILSAVFMFILASALFGNLGGLLASILYTYVPYHAVNIYVRGAMNEAWAAVFFPLIFYFSKKLIENGKTAYMFGLAVSLSGLLLSHNPMVLTFAPILIAWCLYWLFVRFGKKIVLSIKNSFSLYLKLVFSALLGLSLTAFFTLPVLTETKYVQLDSMFVGYYNFTVHFVTLSQLFFSNFWGDGPSVWGPEDGMSFMIGYVHWILPFILVLYSAYRLFKFKKLDNTLLLFLLITAMGLSTAFMTHNKSGFIWLAFPEIQKIQFPWRFLNHTAFLFSLSAGFLAIALKSYLKDKYSYIVVALICFITIGLNINYFHPKISGPLTDEQKFSGKAWINQVTSGIYDYLPKTARIAAQGPAKEYVDQIEPQDTNVKLFGQKKGTDWMFFNIETNKPAKVTLAQLSFPGFEVLVDNKKIDYSIEPELGRLVINVDSGQHNVFVKLRNTPIRTISNTISLLAWIVVLSYFFKELWKLLTSRKSK